MVIDFQYAQEEIGDGETRISPEAYVLLIKIDHFE